MANLSAEKRQRMLAFLDTLRKDTDDAEVLRSVNEIEAVLNEKKYGLVWEEHTERVDELLIENIPVLDEVKERQITVDKDSPYNFLIEGDNLHSLYLLEKMYCGKVDIIYIDPPYNTGNRDFIYNDAFIDKTDTYRHSKWVSFMERRLRIARQLLSIDGAIFINIDDNEYAQLKLLCDEVFGESNFIATLPWHNRTSIQNDTDISINHEYVLVYAKYKRPNNRRLNDSNREKWETLKGFTFNTRPADKSKFSNPDNDPRGLWKADPFDAPNVRPNLTYEIVNPNTKAIYLPPAGRCWRMGQDKYEEALRDGRIIFGRTGRSKPQLKVFYSEVAYKGMVADSWLDAEQYSTSTNGKKQLLRILPNQKEIFSTPKPVELYVELMKLSTRKDSLILDFFAGSGTTGHAVVQLNKEDGGNRKYILCTNNESNICEEVTYQRLKNIQEELPHNLKYLKTGFVPRTEETLIPDLLAHVKPLVELTYQCDLDNSNNYIFLDEEEFDDFLTPDVPEGIRIFIPEDIFTSGKQEAIIEKKGIHIVRIPECYYKAEMLEEGLL